MTTATRFGVNYVPSTDWMFQWQSVDVDVVRRDLEAVAGLGLTLMLDGIEQLVARAEAAGGPPPA